MDTEFHAAEEWKNDFPEDTFKEASQIPPENITITDIGSEFLEAEVIYNNEEHEVSVEFNDSGRSYNCTCNGFFCVHIVAAILYTQTDDKTSEGDELSNAIESLNTESTFQLLHHVLESNLENYVAAELFLSGRETEVKVDDFKELLSEYFYNKENEEGDLPVGDDIYIELEQFFNRQFKTLIQASKYRNALNFSIAVDEIIATYIEQMLDRVQVITRHLILSFYERLTELAANKEFDESQRRALGEEIVDYLSENNSPDKDRQEHLLDLLKHCLVNEQLQNEYERLKK